MIDPERAAEFEESAQDAEAVAVATGLAEAEEPTPIRRQRRQRAAAAVQEPPAPQEPQAPDEPTTAEPDEDDAEAPLAQSKLMPPEPIRLILAVIPVDSIVLEPGAPERADKALVDSIRDIGLLEPVHVEQDGQYFYVREGRKRVAACHAAGLTEIPAVVITSQVEPGLPRLVMAGHRKPNMWIELQAIESLLKALEKDGLGAYREISRVTGLTLDDIKVRLSLRKLIEPLALALAQDQIANATALRCAVLPDDKQHKLAAILRDSGKLTSKDVREVRDEGLGGEARATASFQFSKWRPVAEEVRDALQDAVTAADRETPDPAAVDNLIVAVHETVRRLTELLAKPDDD